MESLVRFSRHRLQTGGVQDFVLRIARAETNIRVHVLC